MQKIQADRKQLSQRISAHNTKSAQMHAKHRPSLLISTWLTVHAGVGVWVVRLEESSAEDSGRPQAAKRAHQRL